MFRNRGKFDFSRSSEVEIETRDTILYKLRDKEVKIEGTFVRRSIYRALIIRR